VTHGDKFVRDRDDDAVDILHPFRRRHEGVEVRDRHLHRNADRIDPALGEDARQPGRRFRLADRIADDKMDTRFAAQPRQHGPAMLLWFTSNRHYRKMSRLTSRGRQISGGDAWPGIR